MATLQNVLDFARTVAQTDTNGLTDSSGIQFANEARYDFRRKLISHGIDASSIVEVYRDATAGQGTYLYPDDLFFLKAIELNYTDSSENNYVKATQIDVSNISGGVSFSWMRKNADRRYPQFDDRGDWYEIFPTPQAGDDANALIRLFYFAEPTEFIATTDSVDYPEDLDYRLLSWRVASSFFYSLGRIDDGDKFDLKYQEKVRDLVGTLGRGSQQPIQFNPIQMDGWLF